MFYKQPDHSRSFPTRPLRTSLPRLSTRPAPVFFLAIALLGFFPSGVSGQATPDSLLQRKVDDSLSRVLLVIDRDDQKYRNQMDDTLHKYGGGSPQMAALYRKMAAADSFNLVKVTAILEKYGWLSADRVGVDQNSALFMVIQHSNLKTQEKYLPVMRKAVEQGNAQARELALLEDRVAIGEGRKQVYGSQLSWNQQTNVMYVLPMEDPDSVDQRRAKMGLQPMADYLKEGFNLTWDLEAYKKDMSNHPLKPGMH